jgi:bifunctional non-homologous end joining protein LigD
MDFTRRFPDVVRGIRELPDDTVIDREIVALDEHGRPSFNLLQGFGTAQSIVLYAFDLLMLRGKDVRLWPLEDRRDSFVRTVKHLPTAAEKRPAPIAPQARCLLAGGCRQAREQTLRSLF